MPDRSSSTTTDCMDKSVSSPDDVIDELGGCGRFQIRTALLIHTIKTLCNWSLISMVFVTAVPKWRCAENDLSQENTTLTKNVSYDNACYTSNGTSCFRFEFDNTMRTIVNEWDLVCEHGWIPSTIMTIQIVVNIFGYIFAGHLADTLGRRIPFFLSVFLMMTVSLISYFSVNWIMFAIARCIIAIASGLFLTIQYSYLSEFTLSRWRSWFIGFPSWPIESCFLALALWLLKDWRNLQLAIAAVGVPSMAAWWLMPESFRWYYGHDRVEDAERVIKTVSKVNRRPVPDMTYMKQLAVASIGPKQTDKKYSVLDIFSSRFLIKVTLLMSVTWIAIGVADYSITFGIQNLAGSIYFNMFLFNFVQIPSKGLGIWLQNRFGRRKTSILVYFITGLSALIAGTVQYIDTEKRDELTTGFALVANLAIATAWGPLQTITIEIYPTVIRNIGFSFCAILAHVGAAVAPQLVHMETSTPGVMYFTVGGMSLLGCCAFFGVPETNNENLSDKLNVAVITPSELNNINRDKTIEMASLSDNGTVTRF